MTRKLHEFFDRFPFVFVASGVGLLYMSTEPPHTIHAAKIAYFAGFSALVLSRGWYLGIPPFPSR